MGLYKLISIYFADEESMNTSSEQYIYKHQIKSFTLYPTVNFTDKSDLKKLENEEQRKSHHRMQKVELVIENVVYILKITSSEGYDKMKKLRIDIIQYTEYKERLNKMKKKIPKIYPQFKSLNNQFSTSSVKYKSNKRQ